jgi:hypothetical protein
MVLRGGEPVRRNTDIRHNKDRRIVAGGGDTADDGAVLQVVNTDELLCD